MVPKFVIPYRLQGKRGKNDANLVAIAAKNARMAWALLAKGQDFQVRSREAPTQNLLALRQSA